MSKFNIKNWVENYEEINKKFPEFCKTIQKTPIDEAGCVLNELNKCYEIIEVIKSELETYIDGTAFCSESGFVWEHRLMHSKEIIEELEKLLQ